MKRQPLSDITSILTFNIIKLAGRFKCTHQEIIKDNIYNNTKKILLYIQISLKFSHNFKLNLFKKWLVRVSNSIKKRIG